MYERPRTTGLALSGGGSRAACEVGMLRALYENDIKPDFISGTSAGAVIGVWHSLFPDQIDRLELIWLELRTRDIFRGNHIRLLTNFVRHGHVYTAHAWERFLWRQFGDARFEDLSVPCSVVAVELEGGAVTVFDSGKIVPAMMASTAIPGVFPPVSIAGKRYVDGGVLEYLPVTPLLAHGVDLVYAFDCSHLEPAVGRGMAVMDRCDRISARAEADRTLERLRTLGIETHLLRPPLPEITDPRSFGQSSDLIHAGYRYAVDYLSGFHSVSTSTAAASAE